MILNGLKLGIQKYFVIWDFSIYISYFNTFVDSCHFVNKVSTCSSSVLILTFSMAPLHNKTNSQVVLQFFFFFLTLTYCDQLLSW